MKMVKPIILAIGAIPVILAILIVIPMVTMEEIPTSAINSNDYEKIHADDQVSIIKLNDISPGKSIECNILHADKTSEKIVLNHSYNDLQIEWFKAGSAMNFLRKKQN